MRTGKKEIWRKVVGFEEFYEVSSLGRVRSLDRWVKNSRNNSLKFWKGRLRSLLQSNTKKYITLSLNKSGKTTYQQVHVMVATAFLGPKPANNSCVNHKNGKKHDNRVINLEWSSPKENILHAITAGLTVHARGEQSGKATVTKKIVQKIKSLREKGLTYNDIAIVTKASKKVIGDICRGRTWKHI